METSDCSNGCIRHFNYSFLNGAVFGEKYSIKLKKLKFIYLVHMTAILKSPSSGTLKYNRLGKPNISNVLGSKKISESKHNWKCTAFFFSFFKCFMCAFYIWTIDIHIYESTLFYIEIEANSKIFNEQLQTIWNDKIWMNII